jgi:site-specific recombinase XerD
MIRKWSKIKYSKTHSCWYFLNGSDALNELREMLDGVTISIEPLQTTEGKFFFPPEYTEKLIECRYSRSTIENYSSQFRNFLLFLNNGLEDINDERIRQYMIYLVKEKKASVSTQNIAINSIKFYLEHVYTGERRVYYTERPRKEYKLPVVLSEGEVLELLERVNNLKHRILLFLIYSAGLRLSEVLGLRWTDIEADRKIIVVRNGKGNKTG